MNLHWEMELNAIKVNQHVKYQQGHRRHQTSPRSGAAPWWVSLTIRRGVKSILLSSESLLKSKKVVVYSSSRKRLAAIRPILLSPEPQRPLLSNVTSSTKSEVHNVLQRRQRKTDPRPRGLRTKNLNIDDMLPEIKMWRDRQMCSSYYSAPPPLVPG